MRPTGMFNQTITLYNKTSLDRYGRETVGSGTDYIARVQLTDKTKLLPNGQAITVDAIVYLQPDVTINPNDRIDYNSTRYKILGKRNAVDGQGNTNHIRLELIKWLQA